MLRIIPSVFELQNYNIFTEYKRNIDKRQFCIKYFQERHASVKKKCTLAFGLLTKILPIDKNKTVTTSIL